jgi:uncharacterized membrane protein YoaK (UPF0700 family)
VKQHLIDAWRTLCPIRGDKHGPLPPLLVMLTLVTGLVDAFSYLQLNRVFVANMTGNVVFLSFDLGGATGFLWWASVLAIVMFMVGALVGGRIGNLHNAHRGRHLLSASLAQAVLVLAGFVIAATAVRPYTDIALSALIVFLGIAMGLQNATARTLSVPDLTTTVLTLTITGVAADSTPAGGRNSKIGRRAVSVASMFTGGLVGTLFVTHGQATVALLIAAVLLAIVAIVSARTWTVSDPWVGRT